MKKISLMMIVLLLTLVPVATEAAPLKRINVGLQDVIDTVEKSYRVLTDVTADFFQRSTLIKKNKEMRADGQMFVRTPNSTTSTPLMFRFDYFRPATQEIVCNGRTMWIYLPENRQVIVSDVSFSFNPFNFDPERDRAVNFLQGLGRISKDFQVIFSPQRQDIDGNYILELNPRRATAFIAKLFIVVRNDAVLLYVRNNRDILKVVNDPFRSELAFPILSTTMIDHQGNTTIMEFSNISANTRLSEQLFNFSAPANVQVVRPPTER